jgi:hypothetical protein
MKMDAKIDMLHRSGLFGKTPGRAKRVVEDLQEEEDVRMSIVSELNCMIRTEPLLRLLGCSLSRKLCLKVRWTKTELQIGPHSDHDQYPLWLPKPRAAP